MTRGRSDVNSRKRLISTVLVLVIVGAFLYFYFQSSDSSPVEYGDKFVRHFGLGGDRDDDESSSILDSAVPKSIPVS